MKALGAVRNVHLGAGLFVAAGLILYGWSAVQMTHRSWFTIQARTMEREVALPRRPTDPRDLSALLTQSAEVRGELDSVQQSSGAIHLRIVRPGTACDVDYIGEGRKVHLRCVRQGFQGMLNSLHNTEGIWHDSWLARWWSCYVAVMSALLILLGGSGIVLWWARGVDRVLGLVLLALNLSYTVAVALLIRMH